MYDNLLQITQCAMKLDIAPWILMLEDKPEGVKFRLEYIAEEHEFTQDLIVGQEQDLKERPLQITHHY